MINTSHVLVSTSYGSLRDALETGANIGQSLNILREENTLLFSTIDNPNFVSFEAEFLSGGSSQYGATLVLLDPLGEFEERLLKGRLLDKYNNWEAIKDTPDTEDAASKQDSKQALSDLENPVLTPLDPGDGHWLYIVFGTGSNTEQWSSIYRFVIDTAFIDFSSGRKITLGLKASNAISKDEEEQVEKMEPSLGITYESKGRSKAFNFSDSKKPVYSYTTNIQGFTGEEPIEFHGIVCDVVRELARVAFRNENVIVLLPDIDKYCSNFIEQRKKEYFSIANSSKTPIGSKSKQKAPKFSTDAISDNLGFIYDVLEKFNISITKSTGRSLSLEERAKVIPTAAVNVFAEAEQFSNAEDRYAGFFEQIYKAEARTETTKGTTPPAFKLLQAIYSGLRSNANVTSEGRRLVAYTESDVDVCNIFRRFNRFYPLLKGITYPGPISIVGDEELIREFLYAQDNPIDSDLLHLQDRKCTEQFYSFMRDLKTTNFSTPKSDPGWRGLYDFPKEYVEKIPELAGEAKKENIPVFKYGTDKPNTISMNYTDRNFLLASMASTYSKIVGGINSAVAQGSLPVGFSSFPAETKARLDYLDKTKKNKESQIERFDDLIKKEKFAKTALNSFFGTNLETEKPSDQFLAAKEFAVRSADREIYAPIAQIQQESPNLPVDIQGAIARDMNNKINQVNIETLPFFHIFGQKDVGTKCILFSQAPAYVGVKGGDSLRLGKLTSGTYRIFGQKHTITPTSAKSSFTLINERNIIPKNTLLEEAKKGKTDSNSELNIQKNEPYQKKKYPEYVPRIWEPLVISKDPGQVVEDEHRLRGTGTTSEQVINRWEGSYGGGGPGSALDPTSEAYKQAAEDTRERLAAEEYDKKLFQYFEDKYGPLLANEKYLEYLDNPNRTTLDL